METRKLYYEDPFQKGFATTVVSCDAVKGGYAVVLAETASYPEGGGKPNFVQGSVAAARGEIERFFAE